MSFWDRYLAPGDLRRQQQLVSSTSSPSDPPTLDAPLTPEVPARIDAAHRARRQDAMFFGGLAFTFLSAWVTRRALYKKQLAVFPHLKQTKLTNPNAKIEVPQFTPSNTVPKAEGGLDAAEALFLATLNVAAIFMTAVGGAMKYFDVADTEDLREAVRRGIGYDVYSGDSEADKEIEDWFAEVLSRKDGSGDIKATIVEKMAELAEIEKRRKHEAEDGDLMKDIKKKREMLEKADKSS
jgi:hypothetical protein